MDAIKKKSFPIFFQFSLLQQFYNGIKKGVI